MTRLFAQAIRILFAPDAGDGGGGGAAPVTPVVVATPAAAAEPVEPMLVRERPEPTPATATPAIETPAVETPAAPAAQPVLAPAAPGTPDKPLQQLQQDYGVLKNSIEELKTLIAAQGKATPPPTPVPAAVPAVVGDADVAALEADAAELERMLSDDYEVDVEKTPRELAKATLKALKAVKAARAHYDTELAKVRTETSTAAATAATEAARAASVENERVQAFHQLQAEIRANHPAVDLHKEFSDAVVQAKAEGFEQAGEKAVQLRAGQLFQARVQTLRTPAATPAAAPAPTPPAAKPQAAAPVTPGGAQVRQNIPGGNPRPPAGPPMTDDEIDARHTLVRG